MSNVGLQRGAIGSVTWTSSNNVAGNPSFERGTVVNTLISSGQHISTKTDIQGHLFGTSSHIEVGANLQFSRETNQHMIMMTGTAILSE